MYIITYTNATKSFEMFIRNIPILYYKLYILIGDACSVLQEACTDRNSQIARTSGVLLLYINVITSSRKVIKLGPTC